jgi:hypothetical protein
VSSDAPIDLTGIDLTDDATPSTDATSSTGLEDLRRRPARSATAQNLIGLVFGIGFGFVLAAARLHEYDTIHSMLRLDEFDVFGLMALAIAVSLPALWWMERQNAKTLFGGTISLKRSRPQAHHIRGGVLFGTGWAVAGTCPAPALAMLGSGAMMGILAIAGIFGGIALADFRAVRRGTTIDLGDGEGSAARAADADLADACS